MDWEALAKFLTSVTAITAILAFAGKKVIEAFLNAQVGKYKSNLEKISVEHSVRFQQLHSDRAQAIKELYEKIVELDLSLKLVLKAFHLITEDPLEKKITRVADAHNDLYKLYLPKKIFFKKTTCSIIDSIIDNSKDIFIDITTYPVDPRDNEYKYDQSLLKERHEFWEKARNTHGEEITKLKEGLEDEFREMLGINA